MTERKNASSGTAEQQKNPPFIDRKKLRRERNAARAAALQAASTDNKGRSRRQTLSVSLSTQQQEAIRREADQLFRTLGRHPDCTQEEGGPRLIINGNLSAAQILGDKRINLPFDTPISKTKIQDCLRTALLQSLRNKKRSLLGKTEYTPKGEAKSTPKAPPKVKPAREEKPRREDDPRRQRRLERRVPEYYQQVDVHGLLEQANALEAQGEWRRAANTLLQMGEACVGQLERIGQNYQRVGMHQEVISNLGPYCGRKGVDAAVPVLVGQSRLKLRQYDKATRVVEPVLNDPRWGGQAREVAATALLEQERPWLALELLEKPSSKTQHELHRAAKLAVALLSEDGEQVADVLRGMNPERLQREAGKWTLQLDLPADDNQLSIRLAPASVAKAVALGDALLQLGQPEQVVSRVFNAVRLAPPETARDIQLHIQLHSLRAQAHFECAEKVPEPQPHLNAAFESCATALRRRPTDKNLLVLAAKISDASEETHHHTALAAILEAARSVPLQVKDTAKDHEPVAEELDKAFDAQAEAKVERRPHRPSQGTRRAGAFNYVR